MPLTSHQMLAVSALVGHCESILKVGVVENEAALHFVLDQMVAAFGLPPRKRPDPITVEPYPNPHLPGGCGFHAHDDAGNHGFGTTREEALIEYRRENELFGDPLPEAELDRGLEAIARIMGARS